MKYKHQKEFPVTNLNPQTSKKLSIDRIGWLTIFASIPFGSCFPGFLVLLVSRLIDLFTGKKRENHDSQTPKRPSAPVLIWTNRLFYLLLIIMILSSVLSSNPLFSLAWAFGFSLIFYVFIFGAQPFGQQTPGFLSGKYLPVLGIGSAIAAIISIARYFIERAYRASDLFCQWNGYGTILIIVTGLTIGYLFWRGGKYRYLTLPFLGLILPVLFFTQSRGGWFGFLAMLAGFTLFNRKLWIILLIVVIIAVAVFAGFPSLRDRLLSSFSTRDNIARIFIWKSTLNMIKDHPVLGVGTGMFFATYPRYLLPGAPEKEVSYAHNIFLEAAVEFGLIGLAVFILMLLGVFYMSFSLARTGNPVYQGIFAVFIGVLVHQQVDIPIWSAGIGGIFWMLVGLMMGIYRYEWGKKVNDDRVK
jgi:O-antigen ligase